MDEKLVIQGSADVVLEELIGKRKPEKAFGEEKVVVCRIKLQGEVKQDTKHGGLRDTLQARLSDVLVLSSQESDEFFERIGEQRAARYEDATGQEAIPGVKGDTEKNPGRGGDSRDE